MLISMNESTGKEDRCSLRPCNYEAVGILRDHGVEVDFNV